ncbi:MAG TPA: VanZ family protein [Candidatus Acidoferrum sp.]|nr:VanZ family protein [Candidatus Acidoferrum sp.]
MHTTPASPPERTPLTVLCVIAALMLMWATLWPFNPYPRNGVAWLPNANALRFYDSGVVSSDAPLKPRAEAAPGDACAIEIYLRPLTHDDAGNLLTFASADNPDAVFLRQWRESLIIYRSRPIHGSGPKLTAYEVDNALRSHQLVLATISFGANGTTVYIDGKVVGQTTRFRIRRDELYRQIVLGNSPSNFQVWHGEIYGLAIYDGEVTQAHAAAHFAEWSGASSSQSTMPSISVAANHVLARYDFRERSGGLIHSEVASAPSLIIPARFSIQYKPWLDSPIEEFEWTRSWRHDVIENVIGFMPFGFVLGGLFALSRPRSQAILMATFIGFSLSFTVESLQYFIPRRDSSWTDVITNTTGTLLGALIAYPGLVRSALRLVYLIPPKHETEANQN